MVKKIFTLVMVMSIFGGVLAGCSPAEEDTTPPATTGTTTPADDTE